MKRVLAVVCAVLILSGCAATTKPPAALDNCGQYLKLAESDRAAYASKHVTGSASVVEYSTTGVATTTPVKRLDRVCSSSATDRSLVSAALIAKDSGVFPRCSEYAVLADDMRIAWSSAFISSWGGGDNWYRQLATPIETANALRLGCQSDTADGTDPTIEKAAQFLLILAMKDPTAYLAFLKGTIASVPISTSYAGPVSVVDSQGFSFDIAFYLATAGSPTVATANDKPGFSTIYELVQTKPVTITNTTAGRTLAFSVQKGIALSVGSPRLIFVAVFAASSPVCSVGVVSMSGPYCIVQAVRSQLANSDASEAIYAAGQTRTLTSTVGVGGVGNYFSVAAVPDAQKAAVVAALAHPNGYAILYSGDNTALAQFSNKLCGSGVGAQIVLATSPGIASCVGGGAWPLAKSSIG